MLLYPLVSVSMQGIIYRNFLFHRYRERKRLGNACDYDDLLLLWKRLLDEVPEAAKELSRAYEHVLVDEYQDTNRLQGEIVDGMASRLLDRMTAAPLPEGGWRDWLREAALLYRQMLLIRGFEDLVQSLFLKGEVYGTTHLYSGQEAVAHFGLGKEAAVDVEVVLPHGKGTVTRKGVAANQAVTIQQ